MNLQNLIQIANNEAEFKKELIKIKHEMGMDVNKIKELISDVDIWCKNAIEMYSCNMNHNYYIMHADYFCMFVLRVSLNEVLQKHNLCKKAILKLTNELYTDEIEQLDRIFIHAVYTVFEDGFDRHQIQTKTSVDADFLHATNAILFDLNLSIIEKLCYKKPYIFFGDSTSHTSLPNLNIIILNSNEFYVDGILQIKDLYLILINVLIENTMTILFDEILTEGNKRELMSEYTVSNLDELKISIGQDIGLYLTEKEITQGIKFVRKFSKENANLDMQIKNRLDKIMNEKNKMSNAKNTYEQKWKN